MLAYRIALLGIKHSGKSTTGRALAQNLDIPFADTDDRICTNEGVDSPRRFYATYGVSRFREAEREAVSQCCSSRKGLVVATGGGIAENGPALAMLANSCTLVYIAEDPWVLYDRVMAGGRPPFLPEHGTKEAFLRLYRRRDTTFRRWCHILVRAERRNVEDVANLIAHMCKEYYLHRRNA